MSVWCQTSCLSLLLSDNKTYLHNDDVKNDAAGKESFLLLLLGLFEQVNRLDQITREIYFNKIRFPRETLDIHISHLPKIDL